MNRHLSCTSCQDGHCRAYLYCSLIFNCLPLIPPLPAWLQEQVSKLRAERETAVRDVALLRADLDNTRGERERAVAEAKKAQEELAR